MIQFLFENCFLVIPVSSSEEGYQFLKLVNLVKEFPQCDMIIDFSEIYGLSHEGLGRLIILANTISANNRRLVICSVSEPIKSEFKLSGFDKFFDFIENADSALEALL